MMTQGTRKQTTTPILGTAILGKGQFSISGNIPRLDRENDSSHIRIVYLHAGYTRKELAIG